MISLRPRHLKRYKDFAVLLWKYGERTKVDDAGVPELLPPETAPGDRTAEAAQQFAADIEKLGPTFIKLGQLLSTRPDLVPPAYAQALARLQDRCEPLPYEAIEALLLEDLGDEVFRGLTLPDTVKK